MSTIYLAIKDFFSKDFLKFTLFPFIASLLLLGLLSYFSFDYIQSFVANIFNTNSILAWFYSFWIFELFLDIIVFLASVLIVLYTSVFVSLFISSFLSSAMVKLIYKKHYDLSIESEASLITVIKRSLKILVKALALLILCIILLFIPMLNLFSFYIFFYYLFSNFLLLDVSSAACSEGEFKEFWGANSSLKLKIILLTFFILSSVPVLGLFLQGFFIIYLSHYFALKKKQLL